MMFQSYINFFLLMLIAIRLDILTEFGVNLFLYSASCSNDWT